MVKTNLHKQPSLSEGLKNLVPSEFRNITPPHLGSIGKPLTQEQKKENQEALKTLREALTSKEIKPTLK